MTLPYHAGKNNHTLNMGRIPLLTRLTIVGLLCLYTSATFGLLIDGISHEVEHKIAEHRRAKALEAAKGIFPRPEPGKTYGCWPTIDLGPDEHTPCPGCVQHAKASVAVIKYFHVFSFYQIHEEAVDCLTLFMEHQLPFFEQSDQLCPEPSIPPPKALG